MTIFMFGAGLAGIAGAVLAHQAGSSSMGFGYPVDSDGPGPRRRREVLGVVAGSAIIGLAETILIVGTTM